MLKASSLYLVIIIALVVGIVCSSLIAVAYFYRLQYQQSFRYDHLSANLNSAVNMLLASNDTAYLQERTFDLYNSDKDSVSLQKINWGIYNIGIVKAFAQKDTLRSAFSIANKIDSGKWCALYLADEERPLGLNGKTAIKGDAFLPMAGVKAAYVNNRFYEGDKDLVSGKKRISERTLPALQQNRLDLLRTAFQREQEIDTTLLRNDSVYNSFFSPTKVISFRKNHGTLKNINLSGNLIVFSDTTLVIDSTVHLSNVQVYAKSIKVNDGFRGICQLFATDTINIGARCGLGYPSCVGLLRLEKYQNGLQAKISIGHQTTVNGTVFLDQAKPTELKPVVAFGPKSVVNGQVYCPGYVRLSEGSFACRGSVFALRFLYQSSYSLYENYLIDAILDSKALSRYYLSSSLLPVAGTNKKVLQWLEKK